MTARAALAREPRIPLAVADAPTQRFYAAAIFGAIQVWKLTRICAVRLLGRPAATGLLGALEPTTLFSALLLDFALVYGMYWLAIPTGEGAPVAATAAQRPRRPLTRWDYVGAFMVLASVDVLMLGSFAPLLAFMTGPVARSLGERRVVMRRVGRSHITGQHTVHIVPYGTARLAPTAVCPCLDRDVLIPVVFNETTPATLTYTVTDARNHTFKFTVFAPKTHPLADESRNEHDNAPDVPHGARALTLRDRKKLRAAQRDAAGTAASPLETVHYLRVTHAGRVRLESVQDRAGHTALLTGNDVMVVECPRAAFAPAVHDYCPGDEDAARVALRGVPPLSLSYAIERDGRLHRHTLSHVGDLSHPALNASGRSIDETAPIVLDLRTPGAQSLRLETVRDACGNEAPLDASLNFTVHPRAHAQFDADQCAAGHPLKLRRGRTLDLRVHVQPSAADVRVAYAPDVNATLTPMLSARDAWVRTLSMHAGTSTVRVAQPGVYTVESVAGAHCAGVVGAPWSCAMVDVPPPRASIQFESIEDPCAGTVGVKALSVLEGEPPFRLTYEVQRPGRPATRHVRVIQAQTRDELEFWPSTEGKVSYRFMALDDANYRGIPLDGPSFTQVVHPLAEAAFAAHGDSGDAAVSSCGSRTAPVDVELRGHGPFELTYLVRGAGGGAPVERVAQLGVGRSTLNITLPPEALTQVGPATVSLLRLRDGKGCERRLATRDQRIDVRRTHAAAAFVERAHELRGDKVALPLRLTGEAPWVVEYVWDGDATTRHMATLHAANAALEVRRPGTYTLLSVRDAHCEGRVLVEANAVVSERPRPAAAFAGDRAANGSVIRAPICANTPDAAPLMLTGHAPVGVYYTHRANRNAGTRHWFATPEPEAVLTLFTQTPGWHTYTITQLSDAFYDAEKADVWLEQAVLPLPRAAFAQAKRAALCLGGTLEGLAPLQLHGTPPFTVEFTLQHTAGTSAVGGSDVPPPRRFVQQTSSYTLLPRGEDIALSATGAWELRVEAVTDAHCRAQQPAAVLPFDVVESAGIVPATARSDYCVGERIDFVLQGTSPWTVHYAFNGRRADVSSRAAEFVRLADEPGTLVVYGAAHQQNQCRKVRAPSVHTVHALPSAVVKSGTHFVESLRAGAQAEIRFHLSGEPPFAFTYQRTQPADLYTHPRVLETHTVDSWASNEYVVHTTQEGTWSVIWLQDRWCQVSLGEASGPATWRALT